MDDRTTVDVLRKAPSRVFYGWWLVGLTVFALATAIAPIIQGLGTFFVALEHQFGWSRTTLAGAFSLSRVEGALLGPIEGFLTDRLGTRRMILIGFAILGAGLIGLSLVQTLVGFYIAFVVIFTGAGLGGFLPFMAAINHWFVRRRAIAMAIGMTGFNLAGLLVPAIAWSVSSLGWRITALVMGIIVWALAIPVALAIRNRPEEHGLSPDGASPDNSITLKASSGHLAMKGDDTSFTLAEALRTTAFWAIAAAHGFSATAVVTITVHIIPALTDIGMSLQKAGTVVAIYTLVGVVFQLVSGIIGDRIPKPPAIAAFIAVQGIGLLVIASLHTMQGALIFAMLFGIGFGGRTPLLTAIRGEYFGRRSFATITGVSMLPMNLGMMAGPLLAGYLFDRWGSYNTAFLGLAILNLVGAAVILLARKPTRHSTH